jgi:hypothetical protein
LRFKRNPFATSRYFNITQKKKSSINFTAKLGRSKKKLTKKKKILREKKRTKKLFESIPPYFFSAVKRKEIFFPLQSDLLD